MGRKEDRARRKAVQKKMGKDSVERLESLAFRKLVAEQSAETVERFLKSFTIHLGNVMKENRISKDRAKKIVEEAIKRTAREDKNIEIEEGENE